MRIIGFQTGCARLQRGLPSCTIIESFFWLVIVQRHSGPLQARRIAGLAPQAVAQRRGVGRSPKGRRPWCRQSDCGILLLAVAFVGGVSSLPPWGGLESNHARSAMSVSEGWGICVSCFLFQLFLYLERIGHFSGFIGLFSGESDIFRVFHSDIFRAGETPAFGHFSGCMHRGYSDIFRVVANRTLDF